MIRAVLDANVLVSGIVTEGVPRSILRAWRAGHFHLVESRATLEVVAADPSDDRYLECAVEGEADCLVTGDRHLLEIGVYRAVEILSPREFVELLAARRYSFSAMDLACRNCSR
jgi:predicted nucleic acid-binding protein